MDRWDDEKDEEVNKNKLGRVKSKYVDLSKRLFVLLNFAVSKASKDLNNLPGTVFHDVAFSGCETCILFVHRL